MCSPTPLPRPLHSQKIKLASFRKLFRSQVDPGVITGVLTALCAYFSADAPTDGKRVLSPNVALRFLHVLSRTPSFDMTTMMFTATDRQLVQSLLTATAAAGAKTERLDAVKTAYL